MVYLWNNMTKEEKIELVKMELLPKVSFDINYNPLENHDEAYDIVRLMGRFFNVRIDSNGDSTYVIFWNKNKTGRGESSNKFEAICMAALNALGVDVFNNPSREPNKFYVYAIFQSPYRSNETRVVISEKTYWLENGCCQDCHLEEDPWIDSLLEKLKLEEEMESEFATYLSAEQVLLAFKEHPSFEYDEKFQKFIEEIQ